MLAAAAVEIKVLVLRLVQELAERVVLGILQS
jgi:hypothetical protein